MGNGNALPGAAVACEEPVASKASEEWAETLVADAQGGAELVARDAVRRGVEQVEEARPEIGVSGSRAVVGIVDDVETNGSVLDRHESDVEGIRSGSRAVLDGDSEVITEAADVKGAVGPGVEVARSAEGLTGVSAEAALLGVMDDDDGDVVLALHLAEEGEENGAVAGSSTR